MASTKKLMIQDMNFGMSDATPLMRSPCSRTVEGSGSLSSITSSVMATAKIPSVNASMRCLEKPAWVVIDCDMRCKHTPPPERPGAEQVGPRDDFLVRECRRGTCHIPHQQAAIALLRADGITPLTILYAGARAASPVGGR